MEVANDNMGGRLRSTTRKNVVVRNGSVKAVSQESDLAWSAVQEAGRILKPSHRNVIVNASDRDRRAEGFL